ncbi:hypothetical protein O3S80_52860, partial [Streptomyces sp. Lzd4kr]|nr:hypothetical protein [Streptomyces sp. Lzd4kr]
MSDTNYAVIYDLHSHTTASDGCLTPEALVHRAVDKPGSILYAGRIVAGITGATGAVAGAYIADITDGEDRARHFGLMSYWLNYAASEQIVLRVHHMRCEIPHRCVRRKYRIRRSSASSLTD